MQHFWNTIKNLFAKSTISLETAAIGLLSHFYTGYSILNLIQQTKKVY